MNTHRVLLNDVTAIVDMHTIEHSDVDARFLALIDDLVEMHPTGCGHRREPLRAEPRGCGEVMIVADLLSEHNVFINNDGHAIVTGKAAS